MQRTKKYLDILVLTLQLTSDYAHRLSSEKFEGYFSKTKVFAPRPSDLSYFNWETQKVVNNSTANFQVICDNINGIVFKNKRDRKLISVDPNVSYYFFSFSAHF